MQHAVRDSCVCVEGSELCCASSMRELPLARPPSPLRSSQGRSVCVRPRRMRGGGGAQSPLSTYLSAPQPRQKPRRCLSSVSAGQDCWFRSSAQISPQPSFASVGTILKRWFRNQRPQSDTLDKLQPMGVNPPVEDGPKQVARSSILMSTVDFIRGPLWLDLIKKKKRRNTARTKERRSPHVRNTERDVDAEKIWRGPKWKRLHTSFQEQYLDWNLNLPIWLFWSVD